jgi:hypothetical protein
MSGRPLGVDSFEPRGTEGGLLRFWRRADRSFSGQRAAKLSLARRDDRRPFGFVDHADAKRGRLFQL